MLPAVPIRHWICSLPWGLRALLGYDRVLAASVASAFAGELERSLKKRAKAELGLVVSNKLLAGALQHIKREQKKKDAEKLRRLRTKRDRRLLLRRAEASA